MKPEAKNQICEFPCDCYNPNDCSHECVNGCGAPALLKVWGTGQPTSWMCLKHASYEAVCLERSAYTLRKEIKDALDSDIKDVNFEQDTDADCGHSYWPPTDSCDKGCPACGLEKTEGVRLAAEARAERDADFKNGLYQGHTCGGDFNDMPEELCQGCVTEGKEAERLAAEAQAENEANENAPY